MTHGPSERRGRSLAEHRRRLFGDADSPVPLSLREVIALALAIGASVPVVVWSDAYSPVHNADSILQAMMSVQKLTWYYWGQNRLANVLPFLASFIPDLGANFAMQVILRVAAGMALPATMLVVLRTYERLSVKYLLALAFFFAALPVHAIGVLWVGGQPYCPALALFTIGVALARASARRRGVHALVFAALAFAVLVAAFFINISFILFAVPLLVGLLLIHTRSDDVLVTALALPAWVIAMGHSALSAAPGGGGAYMRLHVSLANLRATAESLAGCIEPSRIGVAAALFLAAVGAVVILQRAHARTGSAGLVAPVVARAGVVVLTCTAYVFVVANLEWMRLNAFSSRYIVMVVPFLMTVAVVLVVDAITVLTRGSSRRLHERWAGIGAALVFSAILLVQMLPVHVNDSFVPREQRADLAQLAEVAERQRATFIAGNYWFVWPAVFDTLRRRQASHDELPFFGLAARGEVLAAEITRHLRATPRVSLVCWDLEPGECVGASTAFGSPTAWPAHAAVVERGTSPSGVRYAVIAFRDDAPPPGGTPVPGVASALFRRQYAVASTRKEGDTFVLPARPNPSLEVATAGPYAQLEPGMTYRMGFRIEIETATDLPDLEVMGVEVVDVGSAPYFATTFRARDLVTQADGTWAVTSFTLPKTLRVENGMEFRLLSTGHVPVTVHALSLRELPHP